MTDGFDSMLCQRTTALAPANPERVTDV